MAIRRSYNTNRIITTSISVTTKGVRRELRGSLVCNGFRIFEFGNKGRLYGVNHKGRPHRGMKGKAKMRTKADRILSHFADVFYE